VYLSVVGVVEVVLGCQMVQGYGGEDAHFKSYHGGKTSIAGCVDPSAECGY
jgi:uncharacterized membrane protein